MEGRWLEVMRIPCHVSVVTGLFVCIVSDCERGPTGVEIDPCHVSVVTGLFVCIVSDCERGPSGVEIETSFLVYQDEDAERCLVPELLAASMLLLSLLSVFCCLIVAFCTKCI
jgi:hypothetical protein